MTTKPNTSVRPSIAVIGGTGHTGRRVADRLRAGGLGVRIGSRSASPPFSWEQPQTWTPVLSGRGEDGAVETLGAVFEQIVDGRNAYIAVERVLGPPAGDFAAYVRRAAVPGAWSREEVAS